MKTNFQDCEDYEFGGGDLVPADFVKPGTIDWSAVMGWAMALVIGGGIWSFVIIVGTRHWKH